MGKPTRFNRLVLLAEYIGEEEVTGGTETSQTVSCASAGGVVGPFIVELQNFVEAE